VTTAKRPSYERGMAGNMDLIWEKRQEQYFFDWDWKN
jgi:hypothetical protein